jgi:hypothetical protein
MLHPGEGWRRLSWANFRHVLEVEDRCTHTHINKVLIKVLNVYMKHEDYCIFG